MTGRIGIIGMGWVGTSIAISTLHAGVGSELLLHDDKPGLAEGEALDLRQGAAFYPTCAVRPAPPANMRDADVVVISAGRGGRPGQSRLDLLAENIGIVRSIATELQGLRGVLVIVSNPVDILTKVAAQASGLPPARVLGTGTMLDTTRLRTMLGRELGVAPRSVHAYVAGEHGDSQVPLWSLARVGGLPLSAWRAWSTAREAELAAEVRTAAHEIIARKGATNHAIGLVTASLLRAILRGEDRILTVSRVQHGALGLNQVSLSLPTIVGHGGGETVLEPDIPASERDQLLASAQVLSEVEESLG